MSIIKGNSGRLQFGLEDSYGDTPTVMAKQVGVKSESFKYEPNKKEEGLLTGGKTGGRTYTMSKGASGSLSTTVRPDEVGYWFGMALGKEAAVADVPLSTAVKKHVFTAVDADESLPSARISIDRIVEVCDYPGSKVNTLSFSAQAEDYLNLDVAFMCKTEEVGAAQTPISVSPLKPLRFYHGGVKIEGAEVADITSVKFDYTNNLEKIFTTQSGQYMLEPSVGVRDVKIDLEVLYSSASNDLRRDYFVEDADIEIELYFISDEEAEANFPYSFSISIPVAQITDASPANLSGDTMKQSLVVKAVQGSGEFISVELINLQATKYIS